LPESDLKTEGIWAGPEAARVSSSNNPAASQLYPVMFTPAFFANRPVLVIGGGQVAERKVTALLQAGARIRVIAPELSPGLLALTGNTSLVWVERAWSEGDVREFPEALLVFAATSDPAVNEQVAQEAHRNGRLVNRVDRPTACDFTLPGVVQSGDITLAVSTGVYATPGKAGSEEETGASPALTATIRKKLAEAVGPEYSVFSRLLRELRPQVKREVSRTRRPVLWKRMIDSAAMEMLRQGREAEARQILQDLIREEA
jgi:precorrin-2 dehydrogenase/sirohydrochlorin ferrochelatase